MKVRSADGTNIWCDEWGGGPPLILVHGTGDDAGVFDRVRDGLAEHFHLYVMHRRGRGKSGDHAAYEFAREVEDILAVIYGVGAPAGLFGHSYGGILSLDAALETSNLAGMVIYEPPNIRVHDPRRTEIVERLQVYMEKGERDEVVRLFLHEFAGLPDEIVARQRQKKEAWAQRVTEAHTIPRELVIVAAYNLEVDRFGAIRTPARILVGGDTRSVMKETVEEVFQALANADMRELAGNKHAAMTTAPDLFVDELCDFFRDHL